MLNQMKSNTKNIFSISVLVLGIASCNVSKPILKNEVNLPDNYKNVQALASDSIRLSWKSFFKDPILDNLIDSALQHNLDVVTALKNMEQLDLAYKQSKLSLMPTLNGTAGANRQWPSKNSLNGSLSETFIGKPYMDDYSVNLALTWEVDIWGKYKLQQASARADYFAQKENLNALKTRLVVQVAQAYYNLQALDAQLQIAQQNILLSDSTVKMTELQYHSGQVNLLAVEQATAQKQTAEALLPSIIQNITVQENALSILTGNYPGQITRNKNWPDSYPKQDSLTIGVPAHLLSRRPDVKVAEYAVLKANAQAGLSKIAMYPSFSLSPSLGLNTYKFSNWFEMPGSLAKTVAINLTQPIFQKKSLQTAYKTAIIEQEKQVVAYKQVLMTAVQEVSDALAKQQGAKDRLATLKQKEATLNSAMLHASQLYQRGMATYLEVITAENNKLQNDLDVITTQLDGLNATTTLYRSLGGYFE